MLCRFYQNARKYTETTDGVTVIGWQWDEYHLVLPDYPSLEADVTANAEALLQQAKDAEKEATRVKDLEEENRLMKAQISAQSDQMDFYADCIAEMAHEIYV